MVHFYIKRKEEHSISPQFLPLQNNASDRNILSDSNIIIIKKSYANTIGSIQFSSIVCPSCSGVGFTRHAFYKRKVTLPTGKTISLRVLRVKCAHCNKTHAVLPLAIIPYKRIT